MFRGGLYKYHQSQVPWMDYAVWIVGWPKTKPQNLLREIDWSNGWWLGFVSFRRAAKIVWFLFFFRILRDGGWYPGVSHYTNPWFIFLYRILCLIRDSIGLQVAPHLKKWPEMTIISGFESLPSKLPNLDRWNVPPVFQFSFSQSSHCPNS